MNILALITTFLPAITAAGGIAQGLWPALSQAISALSGVNPASHNNVVSLIQDALNKLQTQGVINFGKPLKVDGIFGLSTFGAVKALQAKIGVPVAEPAATAEYEFLSKLMGAL